MKQHAEGSRVAVHNEVDGSGVAFDGSGKIPTESILAQPCETPHEEAKRNMAGLVAVGASLLDVMGLYDKRLTMPEVIALSGELAVSGVERVRVLYEYQKKLKDKKAFGQACVEAGLSPVSVALVASRANRHTAKKLIEAFGVDEWLGGVLFSGGITLGREDLARMVMPLEVIPCELKLRIKKSDNNALWEFSFLRELDWDLHARGCRNVSFPVLVRVGGFIDIRFSDGMQFPALKEVGESHLGGGVSLEAEDATEFGFPMLESTTGNVLLTKAFTATFPALRCVGGSLWAGSSVDLSLPSLMEVKDRFQASHSMGLSIPNLKQVNGKPWSGGRP